MKKTLLIFDDEDDDFTSNKSINQSKTKVAETRYSTQSNQNTFKVPTNLPTSNSRTKPQQYHIQQRQRYTLPQNMESRYQINTYHNNHNTNSTFNHQHYPNNIPSPQQLLKHKSIQQIYQPKKKTQMFQQPNNVPKLKNKINKIKIISHQTITEDPSVNQLLSSDFKYNIPTIPPPRLNNNIYENNRNFQFQPPSHTSPPPPTYFNSQSNKNKNESEYNFRQKTQYYSQFQTQQIDGSNFIKKKVHQETIKYQPISFSENNQWSLLLNDQRLYWKNSKNIPLQITIMLRQLMYQSKQMKISPFQNQIPIILPVHISSRFNQYGDNILRQIKALSKQFPILRQVKNDGNCFYRSFIFNFLQMALTHKTSVLFLKFLSLISNPIKVPFQTNYQKINKNNKLSSQNMRSFVLHRLLILYSYRVTLAQENDQKWEFKIVNLLQKIFSQAPYCFDTFIIVGLKNLISSLLQSDREAYVNRQKISQINEYGNQYDQPQELITILSNTFNISISLYQQKRGKLEYHQYGKNKNDKIFIYCRKYHYEIIYPQKIIYEHIKGK